MVVHLTARVSTLLILAAVLCGCSRLASDDTPAVPSSALPPNVSRATKDAALTEVSQSADAAPPGVNSVPLPEERILHFAWKPERARSIEYAMQAREDQHTIFALRGVEVGKPTPVVVAFHGQPRRRQPPHTYAFPRTVAEVARRLVESRAVTPFVLVTPVFRFEGQNWPNFEPAQFVEEVKRILANDGIAAGRFYFVGHSGAAGCGGGGLNHVADASPSAVGFFDTCVGAGFLESVRELGRRGVPTFIAHSVETAGYQPREPTEYESHFDFGKVYSKVGLLPTACPERLPDAPLRKLEYRCAANPSGTVRALVIDTGEGEKAHEALVPVALRYFLMEYLRVK